MLWFYLLILCLVSEVRKVYCQSGGQGLITLGVMTLDRFLNFAIHENFHKRFLRNYESYKAESLYKHGQ